MTFKPAEGKPVLIKDLSRYKACGYWLQSFRSPETGRGYILHLKLFCRFHNTKPDAIIKKSPEQLETMLMKYIVYLKKNAVTYQTKPQLGRIHVNTIGNYLFGVKHFLKKTIGKKYREIDWEKINDMIPERLRTEYRAYTKEEIKKLLDIADIRMKVIILLMTSGGMRVGALPDLKFKHIKELPNGMGTVSLYADSAKDHYFSFLNLECMTALKRWKEYRLGLEENVTDESFILRDHFAHFSARTNKAKPLKRNSISRRVRQLVVKVLKDTDNLQTDHGFRKFFDTCLMNSDVNYQFKELLMGHSINLDNYYYDERNEQSRQKILAEYLKANDSLTINDEYRLRKEVLQLKEELKNSAPKEMISDLIIREEALKTQIQQIKTELKSMYNITKFASLVSANPDGMTIEELMTALKSSELEKVATDMKQDMDMTISKLADGKVKVQFAYQAARVQT